MTEKEKRMVECIVTHKKAEGLDCVPYPGELGQKIYAQVSKEGWQMWLSQMTMLLNDFGLRTYDESAQKLIEDKMQEFFFSDKSMKEKAFKPPNPLDK